MSIRARKTRRSRAERRRGTTLYEVVFACSYACAVLGLFGTEVMRQRLELGAARGEARAHAALVSAYERLRAGVLTAPSGGTAAVSKEDGVEVSLERATLSPTSKLASPGLVAVTLRATWRDVDGKPRSRLLTTIVEDAPADGGVR